MKMMQGAAFRACSKRSRTRAAPTPTNISTNSDPEMEKNGTLASPATARASNVLPVPGRPDQQNAFRNSRTETAIGFRVAQERHNFLELEFRFVHSGYVLERHLGIGLNIDLGAGLSDRHQAAEPLPLGDAPKQHHPDQVEDDGRQHPGQDRLDQSTRWSAPNLDVMGSKLVGELRIDADREERPLATGQRLGQRAPHRVRCHGDLGYLPLIQELLKLAIGDGFDLGIARPEILKEQDPNQGADRVPDHDLAFADVRFHRVPPIPIRAAKAVLGCPKLRRRI